MSYTSLTTNVWLYQTSVKYKKASASLHLSSLIYKKNHTAFEMLQVKLSSHNSHAPARSHFARKEFAGRNQLSPGSRGKEPGEGVSLPFPVTGKRGSHTHPHTPVSQEMQIACVCVPAPGTMLAASKRTRFSLGNKTQHKGTKRTRGTSFSPLSNHWELLVPRGRH